jgi:hypothetical protein
MATALSLGSKNNLTGVTEKAPALQAALAIKVAIKVKIFSMSLGTKPGLVGGKRRSLRQRLLLLHLMGTHAGQNNSRKDNMRIRHV